MSKDYTSISGTLNLINYDGILGMCFKTCLMVSCRMSFFSLFSIASRFSARSEIESVDRGSDASRRTNERPEI